jgi:hypothetical protein
MTEPRKHLDYVADQRCSVVGCSRSPEYEVYLYDYYPGQDEEFFEQDYTCPFLCDEHMEENEQKAKGERRPRGYVGYPFSNRHHAQGYTTYAPLSDVYPLLYSVGSGAADSTLIHAVAAVNDELIRYLAKHPKLLYELHPRRFEELVADLLRAQGFEPTLTPPTRDGGRDILAARSDALGSLLYLIECKRYAPNHKVGVDVVRAIHGVTQAERATKGVIVTTSSFTKDAIAFASPLKFGIGLHDFETLKSWLDSYRAKVS